MSERALMVQLALSQSTKYFVVGTETSRVRLFDCVTESLVSTLDLQQKVINLTAPQLDRKRENRVLTAVAVSEDGVAAAASSSNQVEGVYFAAGTNVGTLVFRHIGEDEQRMEAMSPTEQPITALCICRGIAFVGLEDGTLTLFSLDQHRILASGIQVHQKPTAIMAYPESASNSGVSDNRKAASAKGDYFKVLVGGITSALYRVHPATHTSNGPMQRLVQYAGSASGIDACWLSRDGHISVECSKTEGILRLFELQLAGAGSTSSAAELRRTFLCGQRILTFSFHEESATIVASTFTGKVYLWSLGSLTFDRSDPVPVPPSAELVSAGARGRLLAGGITPIGKLLLVRGSFATPVFQALAKESLADQYKRKNAPIALKTESLLPTSSEEISQWGTTHGRSRRVVATGAKEEFLQPTPHHVESMKQLAAASPSGEGALLKEKEEQREVGLRGGAYSVPILQALHAKDDSLVIELMSLATRTPADVEATVKSLPLPFLVHLLSIIAKRVRPVGARHPLHSWVMAIFAHRGLDIANFAREFKGQPDTAAGNPMPVIRPLLHQYQGFVEQREKLGHCLGRLSIFRGVRSTQKQQHQFAYSFSEGKNGAVVSIGESGGRAAKRTRRAAMLLDDISDDSEEDEEAEDLENSEAESEEVGDEEEEDEEAGEMAEDEEPPSHSGSEDGDEEDEEAEEDLLPEERDAKIFKKRKDVHRDQMHLDDY